MSRSFLGFGQTRYIGQPYTRPVMYRGIKGVVVPLLFQWLAYGASSANPNVNVLVNLDVFACKALDQIRSVYIDNLGSSNPVYIYFPDTGETVSAKANSEGWYPAFSNNKEFWVIGEGFLTGNIPQAYILVSNLPFEASVNTELDQAVALWLASPVITRGSSIYNTAFGIPALGDQLFSSASLSLITPGSVVPLWGTPYPSGLLILTSLIVNVLGVNANPAVTGQIAIESTGVAGILISPSYEAFVAAANIPSATIVSLTGIQTKLDATQTWRARTLSPALTTGLGQIYSSFTQIP